MRIFLSILILILVLLSVGYKYYEWNTVNGLSNLYKSAWKQEFKAIESYANKSDNYNLFFTQITAPKTTRDNYIKQYPDLKSKLNLLIESEENYRSLISKDRDQYRTIKQAGSFFFGSQGDFVKKMADYQLKYLDDEIERTNRNLASLYLQSALNSIFYDFAIALDFDQNLNKDKNYLRNNFSDISTFQSYISSDFKFEHEEEIKKYFPEGLVALQKYKKYLSTYYLVGKDIINGDADSALYKITDISNNAADLTLNFKGLFHTGDDQETIKDKDIVDAVSNGAALIKQFEKNNLGKYPLLPEIKIWKEDLVLCQMYDFKSITVYNSVTSKYPNSKNFSDLLSELSDINPKTDFVDKDFDKSVVNYTNDDKKIEFQCKDKIDGDTLTFSFKKS